jgi:arylsulfatase
LIAVVALVLTTMAVADDRPNIVVILADDMGFSDAGCYGSEIATPNLDRLAANGVRFTQFYNTARCCPTRASLLTGLYPHQAAMGHMTGTKLNLPGYRGDLSHQAVTIAEVLRPAGYSTYMCGKWHVTSKEGPDGPKDNWPMQRGFERYYGTIKGGGSYFDPAALTRDNTRITPVNDSEYVPKQPYYYTDAIGANAVKFIQEHQERSAGKPLFMYVAFTSPHWPLHAPEETVAKYKGKYDAGYEAVRARRFERMKQMGVIDPKWELSPAPETWSQQKEKAWEARCMEVYAAQIDRMDQNIGFIVDALKETNRLDNTLILFMQDNGGCAETMGREAHEERTKAAATRPMKADELQEAVFPLYTREGQPVRDGKVTMPGGSTSYIAYGRNWANVSDTPFKEYKHFVHEGGISSELIVHWPNGVKRHGELERQPAHLIDVMPTCVDLAKAEYPKTVEAGDVPAMAGVSLLPAMEGKTLARSGPIFFEHEGNRAVRDGKWKLVAKGVKGEWELYDMEADRTEMHNLASEQPEQVKAMARTWRKWAEESQVLPMVPWAKGKGSAE